MGRGKAGEGVVGVELACGYSSSGTEKKVLALPYPPSINRYYARSRWGGQIIGAEGRAYRATIIALVQALRARMMYTGRLAMVLHLYPPDKRVRDVDNIQKPLLDAMQHAGVYQNDSQIKALVTLMHAPIKGGLVRVKMWEQKKKSPGWINGRELTGSI